ncbi:hypothetical protein H696_03308 [Fonticula alba]|uniref:Rho-GAP domain-containing protein n=1 Tax=Fonticula alba TaxID=691883 RepID=A0A058Z6D8_FONAL|nr:hypothetical protein H696_03308 [Fonticula alba]KCV69835.1 hypothetical protein H696_03308 [Fonticula alba]|eukprot:XP_009495441.1 hypothetical protein H696_03308 [Fonticula alba]
MTDVYAPLTHAYEAFTAAPPGEWFSVRIAGKAGPQLGHSGSGGLDGLLQVRSSADLVCFYFLLHHPAAAPSGTEEEPGSQQVLLHVVGPDAPLTDQARGLTFLRHVMSTFKVDYVIPVSSLAQITPEMLAESLRAPTAYSSSPVAGSSQSLLTTGLQKTLSPAGYRYSAFATPTLSVFPTASSSSPGNLSPRRTVFCPYFPAYTAMPRSHPDTEPPGDMAEEQPAPTHRPRSGGVPLLGKAAAQNAAAAAVAATAATATAAAPVGVSVSDGPTLRRSASISSSASRASSVFSTASVNYSFTRRDSATFQLLSSTTAPFHQGASPGADKGAAAGPAAAESHRGAGLPPPQMVYHRHIRSREDEISLFPGDLVIPLNEAPDSLGRVKVMHESRVGYISPGTLRGPSAIGTAAAGAGASPAAATTSDGASGSSDAKSTSDSFLESNNPEVVPYYGSLAAYFDSDLYRSDACNWLLRHNLASAVRSYNEGLPIDVASELDRLSQQMPSLMYPAVQRLVYLNTFLRVRAFLGQPIHSSSADNPFIIPHTAISTAGLLASGQVSAASPIGPGGATTPTRLPAPTGSTVQTAKTVPGGPPSSSSVGRAPSGLNLRSFFRPTRRDANSSSSSVPLFVSADFFQQVAKPVHDADKYIKITSPFLHPALASAEGADPTTVTSYLIHPDAYKHLTEMRKTAFDEFLSLTTVGKRSNLIRLPTGWQYPHIDYSNDPDYFCLPGTGGSGGGGGGSGSMRLLPAGRKGGAEHHHQAGGAGGPPEAAGGPGATPTSVQLGSSLHAWVLFLGHKPFDYSFPLPMAITSMISEIRRQNGLQTEGLFRVPGNARRISQLKEVIEKDGHMKNYVQSNPTLGISVHDVGGLLKLFLHKLADPLFTSALYKNFPDVTKISSGTADQLRALRHLCFLLPERNRLVAQYLLEFLRSVAQNSAVNKMDARNLAVVFAPSCFRQPASEKTDQQAAKLMKESNRVIVSQYVLQLLIEKYEEIFMFPEVVLERHPLFQSLATSYSEYFTSAESAGGGGAGASPSKPGGGAAGLAKPGASPVLQAAGEQPAGDAGYSAGDVPTVEAV